jgi:hypothetical protein
LRVAEAVIQAAEQAVLRGGQLAHGELGRKAEVMQAVVLEVRNPQEEVTEETGQVLPAGQEEVAVAAKQVVLGGIVYQWGNRALVAQEAEVVTSAAEAEEVADIIQVPELRELVAAVHHLLNRPLLLRARLQARIAATGV